MVGIILGLGELSRNVNLFLDFLVEELLDFWDGVWLDGFLMGFRFCCFVVFCVICDILVFCKLCGFLGFLVRKGCNKCKKDFLRLLFGDK